MINRTRAVIVLPIALSLTLAAPTLAQEDEKKPSEVHPVQPQIIRINPDAAKPAAPPVPQIKPVFNPPFAMFKDNKFPMIQRSVLTDVPGRLGHMGVDLVSNRLYVAGRSKGSIEMLAIDGSKQQPSITGLAEPNGVLVLSQHRRLVVSCTGDNSVHVYTLNNDGDPTPERVIEFEGEADTIRFDPADTGEDSGDAAGPGGRVYVAHGRNLGSFDIRTGKRGPSVELSGMNRGFVIDPGSNRIYASIPQSGTIAVIERAPGGELKIAETWALKGITGNHPLALDSASGHLFVVCRNPGKFVVVDTKTGQQVAAMDITDDADACGWDMLLKRVYISCGGGGGYVEIIQQKTEGAAVTYAKHHQEKTNVGCRTSVWVPEQRRLVVAAPSLGTDPTFLYIYFVGP